MKTPTHYAIHIHHDSAQVDVNDGQIELTFTPANPEHQQHLTTLWRTEDLVGWGDTNKLRTLRDRHGIPWPSSYLDVQGVSRFLHPGLDHQLHSYRNLEGATQAARIRCAWGRMAPALPAVERRMLLANHLINGLDLVVDQKLLQEALESLGQLHRAKVANIEVAYNVPMKESDPVDLVRKRLEDQYGLRCAQVNNTEPRAHLDPTVAPALKDLKELSSLRNGIKRMQQLSKTTTIPFNYCYAAAQTLRWSSPNTSTATAENLLALPKSYRPVAEPLRQSISLPNDLVFVAGDLAQVDYRALGYLAGCKHICSLYENDPLADPYIAYWKGMTGQQLTKESPERKVAKAQVLSAMYLQGIRGTCDRLVQSGVSEEQAAAICEDRGWRYKDVDDQCQAAEGAGHTTAHQNLVAHAREGFNKLHQEILGLVDWVTASVLSATSSEDPTKAIQQHAEYGQRWPMVNIAARRAKDGLVDILFSLGPQDPGWRYASLKWLSVGRSNDGLTFLKDGHRKRLTKNLIANNIGQTYARQVIVRGTLELEDRAEFPLMTPAIHDQLLVICHKENAEEAAQLLKEVFNPNKTWWSAIPASDIQISPNLDIH